MLGLMRDLNTKHISESLGSKECVGSPLEQDIWIDVADIFAYPEVWKKAFSLGHNVRFTRTPEVEILRRRIETDPVFAKRFRIFVERKLWESENTIQFCKKDTSFQTRKKGRKTQKIAQEGSWNCATTRERSVQKGPRSLREDNTEPPLGLEEGGVQDTKSAFYLSDHAFFECASFLLDKMSGQTLQEEASGHGAQSEVTLRDEISPEACSALDESMTALYRVLESRFARVQHAVGSEGAEEDSERTETTSDVTHSGETVE